MTDDYECAFGCTFTCISADSMDEHYNAVHENEPVSDEEARNYIAEATAAAFAFVDYAEMARDAFIFAYGTIPEYYRKGMDGAYSAIAGALSAQVAEASRRVFMWGTLTIDDDVRARAKELAMRKFLHDNAYIMGYLDPRGGEIGSWLSDEERGFRDQIKALTDKERADAQV